MNDRMTLKDRLEEIVREMVERGILFEDACTEFEHHFIRAVLDRHNGNISRASQELRIHRNTLSKRLKDETDIRQPRRKRGGR